MELPGYTIEKQIGKGGMAKVYLATHAGLDRKVAIKVMSRHLDEETGFSDRFMREARIVANLSHQNIVTVYDVGKHDGYHYIAMEYLPGGITLDHKIKQGIDHASALITIRQVASALGYAHSKGIVHRDVKPENIMYREDGSAVLTDFGIARSNASETKMTATGTVIGTPHYMSPEQAQGLEVGAHSDIYSLGVVFYEALTGKVPYDADSTIAVIFKHITEEIPQFDASLAQYQPILNRMMAKTREDRYKDCAEIIADLDTIIHGGTLDLNATQINNATLINSATLVNPALRASARSTAVKPPAAGKNNMILGIVSALFAIVVAAGGYLYYQNTVEQQAQAEQARIAQQKQQAADQARAEKAKQLAEEKARAEKEQQASQKAESEKPVAVDSAAAARSEQEKLAAAQKEKERLALLEAQKQKEQAARDKKLREREDKISSLLQQAETNILGSRLNNAYQNFKSVLAIDSKNAQAKEGINRVASQYLALANNEALKGNFDQADKYITSVIQIAPSHNQLAATQKKVFDLKNEFQARQAAQQRQAQPTTETTAPTEEPKKRRSFGGF